MSTRSSVAALLLLLLLLAVSVLSAASKAESPHSSPLLRGDLRSTRKVTDSDPDYDHQTSTYYANHKPTSVIGSATVMPFFSPDTSTPVLTNMALEATQSIDIYTPGMGSWSGCTPSSGCYPCSVEFVKYNETFPVFQALVNKIHQGVRVRIMTNGYPTTLCSGKIGPLEYLVKAGAEVRFYATTTFVHIKYQSIDAGTSHAKAAVSSVNWSYTSYMLNREAGVVVADNADIVNFYQRVFEDDWAIAVPMTVTEKYTAAEEAMIADKTPIPVVIPNPRTFECQTSSGTPQAVAVQNANITAFASPDYALTTLLDALNSVQSTLDVSIYQINSDPIADALIALHKRGVQIRLFTSRVIYDKDDSETTQVEYERLVRAGLTIYSSRDYCLTYSHEKYWIMDGSRVMLSTGNWAPTDFLYPDNNVYPPYSAGSSWRKTNRDFQFYVDSADVAAIYQRVFELDYKQATKWHPSRQQ